MHESPRLQPDIICHSTIQSQLENFVVQLDRYIIGRPPIRCLHICPPWNQCSCCYTMYSILSFLQCTADFYSRSGTKNHQAMPYLQRQGCMSFLPLVITYLAIKPATDKQWKHHFLHFCTWSHHVAWTYLYVYLSFVAFFVDRVALGFGKVGKQTQTYYA